MRLIDADALSKKLIQTTIFIKDGEVFQRMINDAPTVQADRPTGWIPCSERLPNESGWYVISVVGFENITDVSYFYSDESKWSDVSHTQKVVAWMPLPEPYKGGNTDD